VQWLINVIDILLAIELVQGVVHYTAMKPCHRQWWQDHKTPMCGCWPSTL